MYQRFPIKNVAMRQQLERDWLSISHGDMVCPWHRRNTSVACSRGVGRVSLVRRLPPQLADEVLDYALSTAVCMWVAGCIICPPGKWYRPTSLIQIPSIQYIHESWRPWPRQSTHPLICHGNNKHTAFLFNNIHPLFENMLFRFFFYIICQILQSLTLVKTSKQSCEGGCTLHIFNSIMKETTIVSILGIVYDSPVKMYKE